MSYRRRLDRYLFCVILFVYSPPSVWRLNDFPPSRLSSFLLVLLFLCFLSSATPVLWLSTNSVQLTVPIGDDGQLMSGVPPAVWLSTNAVQLTVPTGDDGQLMSGVPPVLWLSTNAVQLTVPICDDGQLMPGALPVQWLSTNAVRFFSRLRCALFRPPFAFLFYARQSFPSFFCSSGFSLCGQDFGVF